MSRKANPTIIGAFIFGALVLVIVSILYWLPGFGEDKERYQLLFEGSVKGLSAGAPVLVKGVRVGTVRNIRLQMATDAERGGVAYVVPVIVELSHRHLFSGGAGGDTIVDLIEHGLRAQLQLDSVVTQQLFVELVFRPETEAVFHHHLPQTFPEIPTIRTGWQTLQEDLVHMDFGQLVNKASSVLDGINRIVNAPELMQSISALEKTLTSASVLMTNLDADRELMNENMLSTLASVRQAVHEMDLMFQDGRAVMGDTRSAIQQARVTMKEVDDLLGNLSALTQDDSPSIYRLETTLDEITATARAMRRFLELLERQPEALLRGAN